MVGRDVQEHADPAGDLLGEVELVGGELEHEQPVVAVELQIEHRPADIAAHRRVQASGREEMVDQGGGRRLAVGAGDDGGVPTGAQLAQYRAVEGHRHQAADHGSGAAAGDAGSPARGRTEA